MKVLIIGACLIFCCLCQKLAQKKCYEYGKEVYQQEKVLSSLRRGGKAQNISTCALFDNPLIVGGTAAKSKEFPHMAVIGYAPSQDSDMDWLCGGSLISERHILTAAHCTTSKSGPPKKVRLGTINIEVNDDYIQEIIVDKFINHPNYIKPVKYHDIAILFLKTDAKFTAFVRPACLNTNKNHTLSKATASGFGKINYGNKETSNTLLKVRLDIITKDVCNKVLKFKVFEMPHKITDNILCAGNLKGGKDTCQGDSGGPLQDVLENPYCMYSIIGVTSFGKFCGLANSPGIYTQVSQYIPWIEETIWT